MNEIYDFKNSNTFLFEQITICKEILFMKPVLLIVDDDPQVLQAVGIDLRHKYGDHFRVLKADSGATALDILKQLKLRNEPPALFLVDQRMPHMTG